MASEERTVRIILDPSVLFTDEAVAWLSIPDLRGSLVVSEALRARLEDAQAGEQFQPYANPDPDQIIRVRKALDSNEIPTFSYGDATQLSAGARDICETLNASDEPLGDVLADEWAFLTSQSLGVIAEQTREALEAFRRAGGYVYEVSADQMRRALGFVRRLRGALLRAIKFVGKHKWTIAGAQAALEMIPYIGEIAQAAGGPAEVTEQVAAGIAVIAGDP